MAKYKQIKLPHNKPQSTLVACQIACSTILQMLPCKVGNKKVGIEARIIHYHVTSIENNLMTAHDAYLKWNGKLAGTSRVRSRRGKTARKIGQYSRTHARKHVCVSVCVCVCVCSGRVCVCVCSSVFFFWRRKWRESLRQKRLLCISHGSSG